MVKLPVHVGAAMLVLALVSLGCDAPELTDEQQYEVDVSLAKPLGSHAHHVLVGSTFWIIIERLAVEGELGPDSGGLNCATQSGSGVVVELDTDLFMVEAPGEGAVELADPGDSCPADTGILAELGPDRWSVIGVEPADVLGRWAYPADAGILDYELSPGPRGVFPDALGRPIQDLRVVADSEFRASPALIRMAGDRELEVRWQDGEHELVVPAHYDDLRPRDSEGIISQVLKGTMRTGDSFAASVTILGTSFSLPPVHAVPVESVASLELVPLYIEGDDEREWGVPAGVLAITRDAEGRRIVGAPVEFEVTPGWISASRDGNDALIIEGVCRETPTAPTPRQATVTASLGSLETTADLEWIDLPTDYCADTCACTSTPPGESAPGLLALFGLGFWLRLRRRNP
jgi:MYXO-CTERM domain-containing protein